MPTTVAEDAEGGENFLLLIAFIVPPVVYV